MHFNKVALMLAMAGLRGLVSAAGIVWSGVVPENHLGGRVASAGYLQGKVFLVDCRDYSTADVAELKRLEDFWQSYKIKPFVLLGSHRGETDAEKVKARLKAAGVTYPVYADAAFEAKTFQGENGLCYVIHAGGKMAVKTRDVNRAYEAAVTAITWYLVPSTLPHWKKIIDYEREVLPGKAYLHMKEMMKAFPVEAERDYGIAFRELAKRDEVKQLAKLEEIARRVKDFDPKTKRNGKTVSVSRTKVQKLIESATALKESEDQLVVQEAKNCIADLKWALATLEK